MVLYGVTMSRLYIVLEAYAASINPSLRNQIEIKIIRAFSKQTKFLLSIHFVNVMKSFRKNP
ncbi:hypothetical protein BpHYR1_024134 [Brachionus plicatilis]|uniref:Uncharacterized protein n=1 Tax=Brachionus plicatilis TaxID=10195 RepID=A0A3M7TA99_BRAPC|nr:hypothetical protein BpHYR1_024134 [Brachionus plicatilis]